MVTPKDAYQNAKLEAEKLMPAIDKELTMKGESVIDAVERKIPKIVVDALRAHYEKDWEVTTHRNWRFAEVGIKIQLPKAPKSPPQKDSRSLLERLADRQKPQK